MCAWCLRGSERSLDVVELELWMSVSWHVGDENQTHVLRKNKGSHLLSSLQPHCKVFETNQKKRLIQRKEISWKKSEKYLIYLLFIIKKHILIFYIYAGPCWLCCVECLAAGRLVLRTDTNSEGLSQGGQIALWESDVEMASCKLPYWILLSLKLIWF